MAVRAYLSDKWKHVTEGTPLAVTVTTSKAKVLNANPNRFSVLFMNIGSYDIYLSPLTDVASSKGLILGAGGGAASFAADEDGELPTQEFWGIAIGGSSTLYVMEVKAV
jgi:hypothetical protein